MGKKIELRVNEEYDKERLDKFISLNIADITRTYAQKIIRKYRVYLDKKIIIDKNYKIKTDQIITVDLPDPEIIDDILPENIPLDVVYEDEDLLVVNKPKGMIVHPAPGIYTNTLVNALLYRCKSNLSGINGVIRPGIVHRIDKDTSGLLIVAKNDFSHKNLALQIKEHTFSRNYEAVVYGNLKNDNGTINEPIGRSKTDRKKMAVIYENSKDAITHYNVIERYQKFTHVRLKLETGRTHQIRVHMAYINHPVAGDPVYGPQRDIIKSLNGQCLHAKSIGFVHPRTSKYIEFESELPDYFKDFLEKIK